MKSPLLQDSVDIIIDYKNYSSDIYKRVDIYNYNGVGTDILNKIYRDHVNYRQFWFEDLGGWLNHLAGDIHVRMDNLVEMNFIEKVWNGSTLVISKEYKYRGRKL